jgi:uncharacterized protein
MSRTVHEYLQERIVASPEKFADFCHRYHIRKLALFGSILREDFRNDSDIDVLVEFEENRAPGFIRLYGIEEELSHLLEGREIDLVTLKSLHPRLRDKILAEAQVQYAQG